MTTAAARRLTEAHRRGQLRIAAQTIAAMRAIWPLLDPDDLDRTFERWITAALAVIDGQRDQSSRLAAAYVSAFKRAEVSRPAVIELAPPALVDSLTTSLLVTGPLSVKRAMARGVPLGRAVGVAEASSAASAMRHTLDAGRSTIRASLAADGDAEGWTRVTSGGACKFCSMLASRGGVYSARTADFEAHDGCGCSAEPVYR